MRSRYAFCLSLLLVVIASRAANSQSFRVQCPTSTITHPDPNNSGVNNSEPLYNGPTQFSSTLATVTSSTTGGYFVPVAGTVNGAIKCQQISGGDGYSTMADGTQIFMFSFGPLSGLADIAAGQAAPQFPNVFNTPYPGCTDVNHCSNPLLRGDPATTDGASSGAAPGTAMPESAAKFQWNGAVGLQPEVVQTVNISDMVEGPLPAPGTAPDCPAPGANTVTAYTYEPLRIPAGSQIVISNSPNSSTPVPAGYLGTYTIICVDNNVIAPSGFAQYAFQYQASAGGLAVQSLLSGVNASTPPVIDGHVDPRQIMDVGVMNGNIPGPLAAFDEDDEFFLTLTNVGMIMRPDLFEQHTVHFHGYPNASSFYDGVPDASVAINIGASFTYYYLAPDAGTYFWHCHITPPEHLQMGMVGQLYVRPRQDRVPDGGDLYNYLGLQNGYAPSYTALGFKGQPDLRTECNPGADILCSATMPAVDTGAQRLSAGTLCNGTSVSGEGTKPDYVYNDGDGSTCYDVTYPIQMHGFDPNFHFVGMTFNPELFVDMKDKYFLLNGRSYPDTVAPGPQATVSSDGQMHYSQPMPAIINIPAGGKASLRLVNLSVAEYFTLQSLGVPMHVVGWNAKLLRDQTGNNTEYWANSITLGGGESNDVILDASDASCNYDGQHTGCATQLYPAGSVFYVYSSNLDYLSNDAENFGGMMTEVHICKSVTGGTHGNTCNN
jgi:FtsP/CotA-like multicopper oxidase with cupredoxin domain